MNRIEFRVSVAIFVLISLFSLLLAEEYLQFGLIRCLFLLVPVQFFATLFFVFLLVSYFEESGH